MKRTCILYFCALALPVAGAAQDLAHLKLLNPDTVKTVVPILLCPPPEAHTEIWSNGLEEVRRYYNSNTETDRERAQQEEPTENVCRILSSECHAGSNSAVASLMIDVASDCHTIYTWAKKRPAWAETRPCFAVPGDFPAPLEKPSPNSNSFPSGHATIEGCLGELLGELYPANRDEIVKRAVQVGRDRMRAGVHFPWDIHAGERLGEWIAGELLKDPAFRDKLEKAKAQGAAAQNGAANH